MIKFFFVSTFILGLNLWAQNDTLVVAVEMDDVVKVRKIINSGQASVDEKIDNDEPIILIAARSGSEKVTQYLISKKVNVNAQNSHRETALMMAVFFGDSQQDSTHFKHDLIAKYLVEAGAQLENDLWWTPLAYAAFANRIEMVEYLLMKGAFIDGPLLDDITPVKTPLMMAAMQGNDKIVHYLLVQGANAKIKNEKGATAYSLAEKYNNKNLLKYLHCAMNLSPGEKYKDRCESNLN